MSIMTAIIGTCTAAVAATGFTTPFNTSMTIGTQCAGGYYAGRIVDAGVTYALIVSPKASGQNGGAALQYKTANTAAPAACQTLTNGPAATAAMVAAGASEYPAAAYCDGLVINGYSDWYLPARDELELLYRGLKPSTAGNYVNASYRTAANFDTGYGIDNGANGYNANSSPVGAGYTASSPVQTAVTAFRTGGTENLLAGNYWSATELAATNAWFQGFYRGVQYYSNKTNAYYVLGVRRVAV